MDRITFTICLKCHSVNKVWTDKLINNKGVCGSCKNELLFHSFVSEVDEIGFDKVISKSTLPVVVDFWAPWCGPCKMFAPTFEEASKIYDGKFVFIKLNTEMFQSISPRLNIRGIPTLMIFKNGKEIARESGAFPLEHFKNWLNRFI